MATIVTRSGKGSPLTNTEVDANFTNLNNDKLETNAEVRAAVEAASDSNVFTDADHTKLNAIEANATADQTAAEILTAIKTVDGAGSGLDADTLDGIASADIARQVWYSSSVGTGTANYWAKVATFSFNSENYRDAQALYSFTSVNTGTTDVGAITLVAIGVRKNNPSNSEANTLTVDILASANTTAFGDDSFKLIDSGGGTDVEFWVQKKVNYSSVATAWLLSYAANTGATTTYNNNAAWQSSTPTGSGLNVLSAGLRYNDYTVWHSGNDGTGSGLDADTLDGVQASALLPLSGGDMTGNLNVGYQQTTSDASVQIGTGRTDSGNAYVDLIGDTTYTDYGLRAVRSGGANGNSQIVHRGTGVFYIDTKDQANLVFRTDSTTALTILGSNQRATFSGTLTAPTFLSTGNVLLRGYRSTWSSGNQTHDVIYNGYQSSLGDYTYLKSMGNSGDGHGQIIAADNGIYFGKTDIETGAVVDSATAPFDNTTYGYFNSSGLTVNGTITGNDLTLADGSGYPRITLQDMDGTSLYGYIDKSGASLNFTSRDGSNYGTSHFKRYNGSSTVNSLTLDADGSARFWDTAGTTAKMKWDAPNLTLNVTGTVYNNFQRTNFINGAGSYDGVSWEWVWGNVSTNTNVWYKVADMVWPTNNLYDGGGFLIELISSHGNYGSSTEVGSNHYNLAVNVSAGTAGSPDEATFTGTDDNNFQLRATKTAAGVYQLQIKSTLAHSFAMLKVQMTATDELTLTPTSSLVAGSTGGTQYLPAESGLDTHLTHKFQRVEAATLAMGDNNKATFGAGSDLQIYHDGSNSVISDTGTGALIIYGSDIVFQQNGSNERMADMAQNGAVRLYHDNSVKLATTATGVEVTGSLVCNNAINIEASSGYASIEMGGPDGAFVDFKAPFSDDYDGRVQWHNGDGQLKIATNSDNAIVLQHNNSTKLATTSTGISVTGAVKSTTYQETYVAKSAASTVTCDLATGTSFSVTMDQNTTFAFTNPPSSGTAFSFTLFVTQHSTAVTLTWPNTVDWAGGSAPDAAAANEVQAYGFFTRDGGTTYYGFLGGTAIA